MKKRQLNKIKMSLFYDNNMENKNILIRSKYSAP